MKIRSTVDDLLSYKKRIDAEWGTRFVVTVSGFLNIIWYSMINSLINIKDQFMIYKRPDISETVSWFNFI